MSDFLLETTESLGGFLDAGGPLLWLIVALAVGMGFLIVERLWYVYLVYPAEMEKRLRQWQQRADTSSWEARKIRQAMISQARIQLEQLLPLLRTLVTLCPLLGLMGTVTGMIEVFDVVASQGTGNARAMAAGICRATLPTMAGLVVALPGLYFTAQIEHSARGHVARMADRMQPQDMH
jgi:biopolymer transport protein ExbB